MVSPPEFRKIAHEFVDWMADYLEQVEQYPVKSPVTPGAILRQLPEHPPSAGEPMETLFADFQRIIMPGITHWQSPNFFAYFNANSSYPSLLAEMLTATLGTQCMIWETSPAAAELEERVMDWLGQMLGLPAGFVGVIHDTASTATLCALLTAREVATQFAVNREGLTGGEKLRVYCSEETHSSIEKAGKIMGIGKENVVKIATDPSLAMDAARLRAAIAQDGEDGFIPMAVVATLGTTSTTAVDPLPEIADVCGTHKLWLHVDAAHAGTALLLPEFRWMIEGISGVDSFVFNPHKWMFTNFDCTAYFVKNVELLVRTFEILPEYLKTNPLGDVKNYRDWGIPLGRRFRALKLWFVIRSFGVRGLQEKVRSHISWAQALSKEIIAHDAFELMAPAPFNLVCFRYRPAGDENTLDDLNQRLLTNLNKSGKVYLTHTRIRGCYALRMCIGQTSTTPEHVKKAWNFIQATAAEMELTS